MHRFLRKAPAATDYFITFPIPFIAQGEGERAGLGHGVRAPTQGVDGSLGGHDGMDQSGRDPKPLPG